MYERERTTPPKFLADPVTGWSTEMGEASRRIGLGKKIRNSVQGLLSVRYFLDFQAKTLSEQIDV